MLTGSIYLIYAAGLFLGLAAGFVMHRSNYCIAGMFRDAFLFRNTFMLRVLFLQIAGTMILFESARVLGFLPLYPFPLLGSPSLANIIGGFIFGIGMVLAGGCVAGTLYKMGAGSVPSCIAFVGMIFGSGIYAEIHPWWSEFIKYTMFFKESITISQATGVPPSIILFPLLIASGLLLAKWHKKVSFRKTAEVSGYIQPWKAALFLAFIGLSSYLLVGMPIGITTAFSKMAAMAENLFTPDHLSKVAFFNLLPLNIVHPSSGALLLGGGGSKIDTIWAIQFPVIAGIIMGSTFSSALLKEFVINPRTPPKQLIIALCGGILLGLSSRMVPGCNVWHLMGGLPILAMQSILFLTGLIPGSWVGSKIITQVIKKQSSCRTCQVS